MSCCSASDKRFAKEVPSEGENIFYHITIAANTLRLPIFGTGLSLVFFKGSQTSASEFPINFDVRWPVKKYLTGFRYQGFSYTPEAFVHIFLELSGFDAQTLYREAVNIFLDDGSNSYLQFFDNLKSTISSYSDGTQPVDDELQNINDQLDVIKNETEALLTSTNLYTISDVFEMTEDHSVIKPAIDSIEGSVKFLDDDQLCYLCLIFDS